MLTQHCTRDIAGHYEITCNVHFCGYSDRVLGYRKPDPYVSIFSNFGQYCSVLPRRGFCTIVLHYYSWSGCFHLITDIIISFLSYYSIQLRATIPSEIWIPIQILEWHQRALSRKCKFVHESCTCISFT